MRLFAPSSLVLVATVGCSFPEYVADLDATIVHVEDSTSGDSESSDVGGDTCTSPCGCGTKDAGTDAIADSVRDATTDAKSDAGSDAGGDAIVGVDGSIGDPCGPCKTGKLACFGPTLACSAIDDRKTTVDSEYKLVAASTRALSHLAELAVGFPMHESGMPSALRVTLGKTSYVCPTTSTLPNPDPACDKCTLTGLTTYTCTVGKPVDGSLTVRVLHGQPTDAAPTELARTTLPISSMASFGTGGAPTTITFDIPASTTALPSGTSIYFELSTDSTAWSVELVADHPRFDPSPVDVTLWSKTLQPAGAWTVEVTGGGSTAAAKTTLPTYALDVRGCF